MEKVDYSDLSDEELLLEKKKLQNSKIFHAVLIGFNIGIALFGVVAWSMNPERQIGFIIPILIPIYIAYKFIKKPKPRHNLEEVLRERNL